MNAGNALYSLILMLLSLLPWAATAAQKDTGCVRCHIAQEKGFSASHVSFAHDCAFCHAGNASAVTEADAHHGMIAFPGDMDSAAQVCGGCHADKVDGVTHSLMHTGAGMLATTREAFGERIDRPGHNDLMHLTHSPADSLLRKQCASCHLGQKKTVHRLNATRDRGGGCLACHINEQSSHAHPALTARVNDARCFGCHSRSGRISLSYAGLAETDRAAAGTSQLEDGRRVEFLPADVHHAAGMGCIDCHTERDLMGVGADHSAVREARAVDIACADCHNISRTIARAQWPNRYRNLLSRVPFRSDTATRFPVTARGTPLWNIELRGDVGWLHRKDGLGVLRIPPYQDSKHPLSRQHASLSCSACHSQWAPQCYGCHMDYDSAGHQYDHAERRTTPGRWTSRRSAARNSLPPLGVNAHKRIVPVVPGMIMTVVYPKWPKPLFNRQFRAIEPHTTGPGRSCASCHRASTALGLGEGRLHRSASGKLHFDPSHPRLVDGLPADAWTSLNQAAERRNSATLRPFSEQEMERILAVPLP